MTDSRESAFTLAELEAAGPCLHSIKRGDCASCVRHRFWYEGRIDGLREAAGLLATNTALVDAMREAVKAAERRDPAIFYNDRLIDRDGEA
jgi:hypothetical protein